MTPIILSHSHQSFGAAPSGQTAFNHLELLNIFKADSRDLLRAVNVQRAALGLPAANINLIPVNGAVYAKLNPANPAGAAFTPFDNSGRVFINADNAGLASTRDRAVVRHLVLHEILHAATSPFGKEIGRLTSGEKLTFPGGLTIRDALVEGLTDVATILMTKKESPFDNYEPHRKIAAKVIDIVGPEIAKRALFGGDKAAVKLLVDAARQLIKS
jgi:hypothetical protein